MSEEKLKKAKRKVAKKKADKKKASTKKASIEKAGLVGNGVIPHTGKERDAKLRSAVIRSRETIDEARWNLAEALYKIHDMSAWANWGYGSWKDYVEREVGSTVRTAQYLTSMFHYFTIQLLDDVKDCDQDDPKFVDAIKRRDDIIRELKPLGWTKAKSLVGVIRRDNADEWIEKAKDSSSSDLESKAKIALNKDKGGGGEDIEPMKKVTLSLSESQYEIYENALELAGTKLESSKRGHLLSMICQDFLATTMGQTDAGQKKYGSYLNKIGAQFGVRIIGVDKETGKIVHGKELFVELVELNGG